MIEKLLNYNLQLVTWDWYICQTYFFQDVVDFPMHFDETLLFQNDRASRLKNEFRMRFRNITTIIDCAACEKCRLWGKLQTQALGTALKVITIYEILPYFFNF